MNLKMFLLSIWSIAGLSKQIWEASLNIISQLSWIGDIIDGEGVRDLRTNDK